MSVLTRYTVVPLGHGILQNPFLLTLAPLFRSTTVNTILHIVRSRFPRDL